MKRIILIFSLLLAMNLLFIVVFHNEKKGKQPIVDTTTSNKVEFLIEENTHLNEYIKFLEEENQILGSYLAEKENIIND